MPHDDPADEDRQTPSRMVLRSGDPINKDRFTHPPPEHCFPSQVPDSGLNGVVLLAELATWHPAEGSLRDHPRPGAEETR